jgi:hypothetical protein
MERRFVCLFAVQQRGGGPKNWGRIWDEYGQIEHHSFFCTVPPTPFNPPIRNEFKFFSILTSPRNSCLPTLLLVTERSAHSISSAYRSGFPTSIYSFRIRQGIYIHSTLYSYFCPCIFFFWNSSVQCRVTKANEEQRPLSLNQQTLRQTLAAVRRRRSRNSRGLLNRCWWNGMVIMTLWILAPFHPGGNGFT